MRTMTAAHTRAPKGFHKVLAPASSARRRVDSSRAAGPSGRHAAPFPKVETRSWSVAYPASPAISPASARLSGLVAARRQRSRCEASVPPPHASVNSADSPAAADAESSSLSSLDYLSLWIGLVVCLPNWTLATSLVGGGLPPGVAALSVAAGSLAVALPLAACGHAGAATGLPFPALARRAFGPRLAPVPVFLRSAVAAGWFSLQSWVAGLALLLSIDALASWALSALSVPPLPSLGTLHPAVPFAAYGVALFGHARLLGGEGGAAQAVAWVGRWSAPVLVLLTGAAVTWAGGAAASAGGLGALVWQRDTAVDPSLVVAALSASAGAWAPLALSSADLRRLARHPKAQLVGSLAWMPLCMTLFCLAGGLVGAAGSVTGSVTGAVATSTHSGDPLALAALVPATNGAQLAVAMGLVAATVSTNLAANLVTPSAALADSLAGRRLPGNIVLAPVAYVGRKIERWIESHSGWVGGVDVGGLAASVAPTWATRLLAIGDGAVVSRVWAERAAPMLVALAAPILQPWRLVADPTGRV